MSGADGTLKGQTLRLYRWIVSAAFVVPFGSRMPIQVPVLFDWFKTWYNLIRRHKYYGYCPRPILLFSRLRTGKRRACRPTCFLKSIQTHRPLLLSQEMRERFVRNIRIDRINRIHRELTPKGKGDGCPGEDGITILGVEVGVRVENSEAGPEARG